MTMRILSATLILSGLVFGAVSSAEEKADAKPQLKVGDAAPEFAWPKSDRAEGSSDSVKLSDLKGKKNVLVAFYPKAFTGGCTKQLCGYRDDFSKFESTDTEIVAVSIDEQTESDKFRTEMKMPFAVLGDPEHKVIDAYGIPLKDFGGNKYAQRAVVLIDKDGKVSYIDMDYQIGKDEQPLYDAMQKVAGSAKEKTETPKQG